MDLTRRSTGSSSVIAAASDSARSTDENFSSRSPSPLPSSSSSSHQHQDPQLQDSHLLLLPRPSSSSSSTACHHPPQHLLPAIPSHSSCNPSARGTSHHHTTSHHLPQHTAHPHPSSSSSSSSHHFDYPPTAAPAVSTLSASSSASSRGLDAPPHPTSNRSCSSSSSSSSSSSTYLRPSILVPVRRTYLDEVPEDLKCPICFDSAVSCQTPCSHCFCYTCISSHINNRLRQQQSVNCPLCRTPVTSSNLIGVPGDRIARVKSLRVTCVGTVSGCTVTGTLSQVEKHEKICPNVLIFCSYRDRGCIAPLIRREASLHENRCRFNPVVRTCRYHFSGCKVRGTEELLLLHEPRCRYRNMEKFVPCPHAKTAGCGLLIKKKYREKHSECCVFKILYDREQRRKEKELKGKDQEQQEKKRGEEEKKVYEGAQDLHEAPRHDGDSDEGGRERKRCKVEGKDAKNKEGGEKEEHRSKNSSSSSSSHSPGDSRGSREEGRTEAEEEREKNNKENEYRDENVMNQRATEDRQDKEKGVDKNKKKGAEQGEEEEEEKVYTFQVSFEWRERDKKISYEELKEKLKRILPNVIKVEDSRLFGEFCAVIDKIPASGLRSIGMSADPQVSRDFLDLNLRLKGMTVYSPP